MSQSRKMSLLETSFDMLTGFIVSWAVTLFLLPLWGHQTSAGSAFEITAMYTVFSFARRYLSRRLFNWIHTKKGSEYPSEHPVMVDYEQQVDRLIDYLILSYRPGDPCMTIGQSSLGGIARDMDSFDFRQLFREKALGGYGFQGPTLEHPEWRLTIVSRITRK